MPEEKIIVELTKIGNQLIYLPANKIKCDLCGRVIKLPTRENYILEEDVFCCNKHLRKK